MAINVQNETITKVLGPVTAYAVAVAEGYQGTQAEWEAEIANASNNAATASEQALVAEGYATGKQNGVDVTSESPYFENNAKHYAQLTADAETTAVQAINTAGTNQVNAVQNKGTQVLNSIPADYTALSEDVADLESAINGWSGGTRNVTSEVEWSATAGGVNYSNGVIVSNLTGYSNADIPLNGATHVEGHTRAGLEPEKAMGFFDSNGIWIPGSYNQGGSSYDWNYSLDVPDGAVTLRLCCATSYINTFTCILTLPGTAGLEDRVEALEENPGITDYTDLSNKPSINGVVLAGDKSLSELGIASEDGLNAVETQITGGELPVESEIALSDFSQDNFRIMANGYWSTQSNGAYYMQIPAGVLSVSIKAHASKNTMFAFLSAYSPVNGQKAPVVWNSGNPKSIAAGDTYTENVPDTATYIWISRQNADGYNTSPQFVKFTTRSVVKGISETVNEIEHGKSTDYSGSYYQLRVGDFKKGSVWRLLLSETTAEYAELKALTDASDTSTEETQLILYTGKEVLWSPQKDYEAIRYGVNGACKLTINDCASLYDKMERKVFYCGASRDYTKLIDAIEAAERYMGSILYVDEGTYNLIDEFGAAYFENMSSASSMPGVVLKNRIHIIFSPNSRVICHYTGDNQYVLTNFSPFNCGQYGFTIENLNLDSSRTRYAVHDERNGRMEQCISRYVNCNIKQDNSGNAVWGSYCCIGGGLGSNHEVRIENCTFESIARTGTTVHGTVSYHPSNASGTDYACELVVKDSYFVTGTIELSGSRTDAQNDTTVIVTNNSFEYNSANSPSGVYYSGAQSYQGSHYNVRAWNNENRQAA